MADPKDFDQIALPHLDTVYRAAWAMCRNAAQADDLTQTTFAKALENFDRFRTGSNCKAWLLRILRNTWYDELRHRQVVGPTVATDDVPIAQAASPQPASWTDAADLLENFGDEQVIRAMGELPDEQRLTLFLTDVAELSQDEAAEVLGVAVGTVKSRTSRARHTLKDKLTAHAKDLGLLGRER